MCAGRSTVNADEVRRGWETRSTRYSPGYYAYYGPNETSEAVRETLDGLIEPDEAVLEVGCSAGRHLQHLRTAGYSNLHGVDINEEAYEVMAAEYPDLADAVTFHRADIADAVRGFDDGAFGAVFSVRTLQHVHPDDAGAFAELARVADVVVTVERETPGEDVATETDGDGTVLSYVDGDVPLYYRDWAAILAGAGMTQVTSRPVGGDTLRAFHRAG